jgi:hypothetical protein
MFAGVLPSVSHLGRPIKIPSETVIVEETEKGGNICKRQSQTRRIPSHAAGNKGLP